MSTDCSCKNWQRFFVGDEDGRRSNRPNLIRRPCGFQMGVSDLFGPRTGGLRDRAHAQACVT